LRRRVAEDPTHAELAEIASEQVARLETMLTELLGYGKPLQLQPTEIRFADIAQDVIGLTRTEAEEGEVSVSVEDRTGGESIFADREQIRRALTNLVLNAVQASPRRGRVVLGAEPLTESTDQMRLFVTDEGRGIGSEEADRLFHPFFTTRDEGTGLGLANVKKIAECHGGRPFARNRPTGGALFGIDLPRRGTSR
jgi:signal transduction histidine kinase